MLEYKKLCEDLLIKYGLENWKCRINRGNNNWSAICRHSFKTIELSHKLIRCSEKYIIDTILHEISHAICGHKEAHGEKWKFVCEKIGCSGEVYGINIQEKYLAICNSCGYHHTRNELPLTKVSCIFCSESYNEKFRLNYKL
jgi:hypothetical protein